MSGLLEIIGSAMCAFAIVAMLNELYLSSKTKLQ